MRKIALFLLVIVSTSSFAHHLKLSPKESKSLTNHSLWTLNATCNIQAQAKTKIIVSVLENVGKVNGKSLSKGHATSLNIKNNASISVSAEPGAVVNLVNQSDQAVEADCHTKSA